MDLLREPEKKSKLFPRWPRFEISEAKTRFGKALCWPKDTESRSTNLHEPSELPAEYGTMLRRERDVAGLPEATAGTMAASLSSVTGDPVLEKRSLNNVQLLFEGILYTLCIAASE